MRRYLPATPARLLALGILGLLVWLTWQVIVWPTIYLVTSRQSDVNALTEQLEQFRAADHRTPALRAREEQAAKQMKTLDVFLSGPSGTAIAVSIQDLIRNAAQQGEGVVTSSSVIAGNAAAAPSPAMLTVRARVDGSLDTLLHVLKAIDVSKPKLFIDNLAISATAPATEDRRQQLSFELSVSAYLATAAHDR